MERLEAIRIEMKAQRRQRGSVGGGQEILST